ncbi:unnamed protein product [Durusdinium trenchii]|uniref:Uncharacterized protein n=2 Tax=Durusdinium trenchii TaxID=1381693 RepID=A0ABP0LBX5_9DINO
MSLQPLSAAFQPTGRRSEFIVVSCYTRFDNLAHGPRGKEAKKSLYTFWMDTSDGSMVLLSVVKEDVMNPAFSRWHSRRNVMYTCTESVAENGQIDTWSVDPFTGQLSRIGTFDANSPAQRCGRCSNDVDVGYHEYSAVCSQCCSGNVHQSALLLR